MADAEPTQTELRAQFETRLRSEETELKATSETTAADRAPVTLDQQSVGRLSRMDAMQAQAMAQASERRRRARLHLVQAALRRFEEGEFGYCEECGEFIGLKRLEVDPAAARCVGCAA